MILLQNFQAGLHSLETNKEHKKSKSSIRFKIETIRALNEQTQSF